MSDELPTSFKDYPQSITERRSTIENSSAVRTPRDVLISLLRDIDSGTTNPDVLVIMIREPVPDEPKDHYVTWRTCSPHIHFTLGLIVRVMHRIQRQIDGD